MTAHELLADLKARGVVLEPKGDTLRVAPQAALTDELRQTIRANKPALLALLVPPQTLPCLPWQLERLLSAAASSVLHCEMRGVPDVNSYVLAWGASYLTGDRDEALRRLWQVYAACQARGVN